MTRRVLLDITNSFNKNKFQIGPDIDDPNDWIEKTIDIYDETRTEEINPLVLVSDGGLNPNQNYHPIYQILYVKAAGLLYALGRNDYGQLGLGHTNSVNELTLVGLQSWRDVCMINTSSLGIDEFGQLYGTGSMISSTKFIPLENKDMDWKEIYPPNSQASSDLAYYGFLVVKNNGNMYRVRKTEGSNPLLIEPVYTSATDETPKKWRSISYAGSHLLVLDENGIPYCSSDSENTSSKFNQPIGGIPESISDFRQVNNNEYLMVATGSNSYWDSSIFLDISGNIYTVGMMQDPTHPPGQSSNLVLRHTNIESISPFFYTTDSYGGNSSGALMIAKNKLLWVMPVYPYGIGYQRDFKFINRYGVEQQNVADRITNIPSSGNNMFLKKIDGAIYYWESGDIYRELNINFNGVLGKSRAGFVDASFNGSGSNISFLGIGS